MFGVGGFVGYGSGTLESCQGDFTLICTDTDAQTRDEQFMGGAYAAGHLNVKDCTVAIDGYDSDHGYVHNGGLVGMYIFYPAGLDFHGTGRLITPLGAKVLRTSAVPVGKIIGLDKNYALEMVKAGDVMVEYDKLIDRQMERAAITTISGYAKIFEDASRVLSV